MDFLHNLLPLFKIFFVFMCMLVGIRFRLGVGPSILAGGGVLALLTSMKMVEVFKIGTEALLNEKTFFLALIVALIMVFSGLLERTGQAGRIMNSMTGYLRSPRLRLVFFPALIGLLPMPGGAIFSAPMIQEAASGLDVSGRDKVVINYWFRHVWELAWPLYPGMILAAALCGMGIFEFIGYTFPGAFACIGLGWFFYLRPSVLPMENNGSGAEVSSCGRDFRLVLKEGLPLIVAIAGAFVFEILLSLFFPGVPFEMGIVLALLGAVFCSMAANAGAVAIIRGLLVEKRFLNMIFMIVCVFVFKDILGACGVVDELARLAGGEAALIAAAVFVPFLVGFISGITLAFVGAAMPLVVGLVQASGLQEQLPAWAVLCMFCGFSGLMASPLHICFLLTCEYFKVDMVDAWKKIVIPGLMLMLLGVAYFFVLM
jgi:integral membrane protein (TIGR00529 family)